MTSYPFDQDLIAFIDRDGATMFMLTAAGRARVQKNDRVRDWRSVSSSQLDPKGWGSMPKTGDSHTARSERHPERFQLFFRRGDGEKQMLSDPVPAETANRWLEVMLDVRQPGETFWIERVQEGGIEVDTGYRARGPQITRASLAVAVQLNEWEETKRGIDHRRVCVGRRSPVESRVLVESRVERSLATWRDELERRTNLILIIALFGILVILLTGNFLGQ